MPIVSTLAIPKNTGKSSTFHYPALPSPETTKQTCGPAKRSCRTCCASSRACHEKASKDKTHSSFQRRRNYTDQQTENIIQQGTHRKSCCLRRIKNGHDECDSSQMLLIRENGGAHEIQESYRLHDCQRSEREERRIFG